MADKVVYEFRFIKTEDGFRFEFNGDKERLKKWALDQVCAMAQGSIGAWAIGAGIAADIVLTVKNMVPALPLHGPGGGIMMMSQKGNSHHPKTKYNRVDYPDLPIIGRIHRRPAGAGISHSFLIIWASTSLFRFLVHAKGL